MRSPVRNKLFDLFVKSLRNQSWPNWKAIFIGEEDYVDGNICRVKSSAVYKRDKLLVGERLLKELDEKPDYVLRLDDDDLISPFALERLSALDFDCYADKYHAYYNLLDGKISLKEFPWLPNTVIHSYQHAISIPDNSDRSLFACNHSKFWHKFYAGKKLTYSPKKQPVYLRIFSPNTMSMVGETHVSDKGISDEKSFRELQEKIKKTGKWKNYKIPDFEMYMDSLKEISRMIPDTVSIKQKSNIAKLFGKK